MLALRYDWRDTSLVTLHNFSSHAVKVKLKIGVPRDDVMVEVFADQHSRVRNDGTHASGARRLCLAMVPSRLD